MAIPIDTELYEKAKAMADKIYKKHSAYKSGWIVKKYKELGGRYKDDGERKLKRWFALCNVLLLNPTDSSSVIIRDKL